MNCATWLLGLVVLLAGTPASADPVDLKSLPSGVAVHTLWDATVLPRDWTINDIRSLDGARLGWQRQGSRPVSLAKDKALWLRLPIEPYGALTPPRWIVEFAKPGLDRIEMFRFEGDELTLNEVSGDEVSAAGWPVNGRQPAFEVIATRWAPVTYYFKISHAGPLSLNGYLKSVPDHVRTQLVGNLFFGAFSGAVALLLALAAEAAVSTRRPVYAAFAVYAATTALACLAASGVLGEWWIEAAPHTLDAAPHVLAIAAASTGLFYLASAVALRELSRPRFLAVLAVSAAGLLLALLGTQMPGLLPDLALGYATVAVCMALWMLAHAYMKGELWTRLHFASLLPYSLALSYPLAEAVLHVRLPPQIIFIIAAAAAVHLSLSYAALNSKLKKLLETRARLQASTTVDPLTGVANYRRLTLQMPELLARARYNRHHGALLLVEVTNLADFRRIAGQRGVELALVRAAGVIRSCVKNIDMVSRVGDASFAIAIEGPVTTQHASSVGTHLIAKALRTSSTLPDQTPLVLRVYIEMVPKHNLDLEQLLSGAARQLRDVPASDPRKIFVGEDPDAHLDD